MQGRNVVLTASLGLLLVVLFWGIQITLFHFNNLLPPAQSIRAYHLEKVNGGYRVEILGDSFKVKLPGENLMENVKKFLQRFPAEGIAKTLSRWPEKLQLQGLKAVHWSTQKLEELKTAINMILTSNLSPLTSHIDTIFR